MVCRLGKMNQYLNLCVLYSYYDTHYRSRNVEYFSQNIFHEEVIRDVQTETVNLNQMILPL